MPPLSTRIEQYDVVVLLSSTLRGPYTQPGHSAGGWLDSYVSTLSQSNPIAGMTVSCDHNNNQSIKYSLSARLQASFLVMNRVGVDLVRNTIKPTNDALKAIQTFQVRLSTTLDERAKGFHVNQRFWRGHNFSNHEATAQMCIRFRHAMPHHMGSPWTHTVEPELDPHDLLFYDTFRSASCKRLMRLDPQACHTRSDKACETGDVSIHHGSYQLYQEFMTRSNSTVQSWGPELAFLNSTNKVAVIAAPHMGVQKREFWQFTWVLKTVMHFLGPSWALQIHSDVRNKNTWLPRLCSHTCRSRISFVSIPSNNSMIDPTACYWEHKNGYSRYLASKTFWNQLRPTNEHVLIFQTDTALFQTDTSKFLEYDYVGAPWTGGVLDGPITKDWATGEVGTVDFRCEHAPAQWPSLNILALMTQT